jgi:hypothetical protein
VGEAWTVGNIDAACERLVAEATAFWKREDEMVDDITVIVVFLNKNYS